MMQIVEVNTGGAVFFLLFKMSHEQGAAALGVQQQPAAAGEAAARQQQQQQDPPRRRRQQQQQQPPWREGIAVIKIGTSRLAMQAELLANELSRQLSIAAPDCRILRQARLRPHSILLCSEAIVCVCVLMGVLTLAFVFGLLVSEHSQQ